LAIGRSGLLAFLVVVGIDDAAREPGDERGVFAAFGVFAFVVLAAKGGDEDKRGGGGAEQEFCERSHFGLGLLNDFLF
jgi:hypothetical protein